MILNGAHVAHTLRYFTDFGIAYVKVHVVEDTLILSAAEM